MFYSEYLVWSVFGLCLNMKHVLVWCLCLHACRLCFYPFYYSVTVGAV